MSLSRIRNRIIGLRYSLQKIMSTMLLSHCAVPENIHTHPTEGIGISWEVGVLLGQNHLKNCMKLNWNFQRGGVGVRKNPFCGGGMDIFLELHISCCVMKGKCYRSMSQLEKLHGMKTVLEFSNSVSNIVFRRCPCKAGQGHCPHLLASAYAVNAVKFFKPLVGME